MRLATILLSLSMLPVGIIGQRINYLNPPIVENRISSAPDVLIGDGNAVAISSVSGAVVATNSDGSVFGIKSGAKYVPERLGGSSVSCQSGVDFYQIGDTEYLIYAVIDGSESRCVSLD